MFCLCNTRFETAKNKPHSVFTSLIQPRRVQLGIECYYDVSLAHAAAVARHISSAKMNYALYTLISKVHIHLYRCLIQTRGFESKIMEEDAGIATKDTTFSALLSRGVKKTTMPSLLYGLLRARKQTEKSECQDVEHALW